MSIRKFVNNPYLIPDGTYTARIKAVRQKAENGRSWTVVCLEIAKGFWKRRLVFDIIRRDGFSEQANCADRAREATLVELGAKHRDYTRACRRMIGRLVQIDVGSNWRQDMERVSNHVLRYHWNRQY